MNTDIIVLENGTERDGSQSEIDADTIYKCDECAFYHENPNAKPLNGCGETGPYGYRCTHHENGEHIARGTNPGSFAEAWSLS